MLFAAVRESVVGTYRTSQFWLMSASRQERSFDSLHDGLILSTSRPARLCRIVVV
jgi:hypothetical protein